MPFLRVLRDKRGYETTYLMHWFRDGSRQRSKILYVFRTPPGVKVGRDPIDPAIIREIEAHHPDIEFDWRALRENQQVIDTSQEVRRPRSSRPSARPEQAEGRRSRKDEGDKRGADRAADRMTAEPAPESVAPSPEVQHPRLVIPAAVEGATREDQLVFLLNWYLSLRERVPHRTHDPIRREALRALVERLNPEAWVGEQAIVAGLQDANEALQRLSTLFSKRRKRARHGKGERADAAGAPQPGRPEASASDDAVSDADEPDMQVSELENDSSE